jgi:hypothetical protein
LLLVELIILVDLIDILTSFGLEFGTLHMEFAYLSDITGNPVYKEKVEKIREFVQQAEK